VLFNPSVPSERAKIDNIVVPKAIEEVSEQDEYTPALKGLKGFNGQFGDHCEES
jgi:hypothetical protein